MNELIPIDTDRERITVSARDLHIFLDVGTDFRHFIQRMFDYGFIEGEDLNPVKKDRVQMEGNREVTREVQDYQLTIEAGKEISMLQRNEKGKQARKYFIELEKAWNSPEKIMAKALKISKRTLSAQHLLIKEMKPKALFADSVSASDTSILITLGGEVVTPKIVATTRVTGKGQRYFVERYLGKKNEK